MAAILPSLYLDESAFVESEDETVLSRCSSLISTSASEAMSATTGVTSDAGEDIPAHPDGNRRRLPSLASSVKINVEGAFIVDEDSSSSQSSLDNDHIHWDKKHIRLPHHTDVVSHVAVDVS